MAQTIHNISSADDGLGDELRAAFNAQNLMNTELYTTKVDVVAGYGLSQNDFTNTLKTKLDALATDAEKNVQSDWNELDPLSDAFILGKPVFESGDIIVSALWTSGLAFDVTADAFPIKNISYAATPNTVTLDAAHATLDRIDLIVAIKPISPATVGTVGFIKGSPATTALVVPQDFDSSIYYVIKQVIIRALATTPEGMSTTQIYDEGAETWSFAVSANVAQTAIDPSQGANSLEGTNTLETDYALFTAPAPISTADIGSLNFDFKNKEAVVGKNISIEILLAGVRIKKYDFGSQENGYFDEDLDYQSLSIDKSKLNLPLQDFDEIRIQPFYDSTGYFIDNIVLHTGSGSETIPSTGIPEAPIDSVLYGRKDGMWEAIPVEGTQKTLILDNSFDRFQSALGGATVVKQYVIPANTIPENCILVCKLKINRLAGAGNPLMTLKDTPNAVTLTRAVNGNSSSRHLVIADTVTRYFNSSGSFYDDLDSPGHNTNLTVGAIDRTIDLTFDLDFTFSTTATDEFELQYLSVEAISI